MGVNSRELTMFFRQIQAEVAQLSHAGINTQMIYLKGENLDLQEINHQIMERQDRFESFDYGCRTW